MSPSAEVATQRNHKRLDDKGHLFVFDQDEDAVTICGRMTGNLIVSNFRYIHRWMNILRCQGKVDGILADLGVLIHQFDDPQRGFSYRFRLTP
jgi:16S rRNA (cytosine1402-N4)-methyltransferase